MKKEDFAEQERRFTEDVSCSIKARHGVIHVVTEEEPRAKELIEVVCDKTDRALYIWKSTKGLYKDDKPVTQSPDLLVGFQQIYSIKEKAVFLFLDVHPFLDRFNNMAPIVVRYLKDMAQYLPTTYSSLMLISSTFSLNPELEKIVKTIELPLPNLEVFQKKLLTKLEGKDYIEGSKEAKEQLLLAAMGLTLKQAEDPFLEVVSEKGKVSIEDIASIFQKKREIIQGSGLLEFVDVSKEDGEIGGQEVLKDWLEKIKKCFSEKAREFGIRPPKGVLLIGCSGCGKSAVIKATGKEWKMLLLRLDIGRIYHKYVGDSESNFRRAIQIAEACSPCILWIDEIEKGFPKSTSNDNTGTSQHVLGNFLTWTAEKKSSVFVMATANNVTQLPLELTRKGRFDEIFFVDLPGISERVEIFKIHLKKRGQDPAGFNLDEFAKASAGYSGSEIEDAVEDALRTAFSDNIKLNTEIILKSLRESIPMSIHRKEETEYLKSWAIGKARNASKPDVEGQKNQSRWDTLESGDEKNVQDK